MRTGTIVFAAYLIAVILGAAWRFWGWTSIAEAVPDLGAVTAAYLGLTARNSVAPAVGGSVVIGYLLDLLSGAPVGLCSLTVGITCLVAHTVQRRILVRGAALTISFCAFIAVASAIVGVLVRVMHGIPRSSVGTELWRMIVVAVTTGAVGPLVWRLYRRIDAGFARTARERDAALEGVAP